MQNQKSTQDGKNFFNLEKLRLNQNFTKLAEVKRELLTIPVRKPNRQDFIRVHPDDSYHIETAVLELKEDREIYLVSQELRPELYQEIIPKVLFTYINKQGVLGVWPVRLPGEDGKLDQWNTSALEIAQLAKTKWLRVVSNMSLGAYEAFIATGDFPEPEFPNMRFEEILKIAFRDKFITTLDHPVVERLRGKK